MRKLCSLMKRELQERRNLRMKAVLRMKNARKQTAQNKMLSWMEDQDTCGILQVFFARGGQV